MASTSVVTNADTTNITTSAFTVKEEGDNAVTSLSPLALGLFLEAGILAVALGNLLVLL